MLSLYISHAQDTPPIPEGVTLHVVQRGESLWRIARDYGVTVEAVAALNGLLATSGIQAGQRLLVPDTNSAVVAPPITPPASSATVMPLFDTLHIVARGETLFRIAQAYGLTINDLTIANNLTDPSLIYVGQQLLIPGLSSRAADIPAGSYPAPIATLRIKPSPFVEGQTASVVLTTTEPSTISATLLGLTLTPVSDAPRTSHVLLFGIPMFTEANTYEIVINVNGTSQSTSLRIPVVVISGGYFTTDITLSPDQQALLAPAVEEFELSTLRTLTAQVNMTRLFNGSLALPAAAAMNAPFGTRRSYNGGAVSRYHNGADFATPPGSPIFAAANGRVVLADTLNIRGNTLLLDHGWGVYTLYAHLTSLNVSVGEPVSEGQIIGLSGSTGRVTGPHLHWEVWVGGVSVDPMQWTQTTYP